MQNTQKFVRGSSNTRSVITKERAISPLKYTVIKTDRQYYRYCDAMEELIESGQKNKSVRDEIELLKLLIEKYDAEHSGFDDADPIELLKTLMHEHNMKGVQLAKLLHVSEGLVSDMLNYRKGLSKDTIRILAQKFKLKQEAFNRPYGMKVGVNARFREV